MSSLTLIGQRYPDRIASIDADLIFKTLRQGERLPQSQRLSLFQALYDTHWKLKGDIEPSAAWRDFALLLLEKGRLPQSIEVSRHVISVYVLIGMRSDRRFDALVAADPAIFDIESAAEGLSEILCVEPG